MQISILGVLKNAKIPIVEGPTGKRSPQNAHRKTFIASPLKTPNEKRQRKTLTVKRQPQTANRANRQPRKPPAAQSANRAKR